MMDPTYTPPHEELHMLAKHVWGPMLWKQLHDRPAEAGDDLSRENEWIEGFRCSIPCDDCRREFSNYMENHPPDFSSVPRYFLWTWGAHNYVNRRLNRRIVPWPVATWGEPPVPLPKEFIVNA